MEPVPGRRHHATAAATGCMIPKSLKQAVPDRLEPFNHHRFRKWNPDAIDCEEATTEISEIKIGRCFDGFGMIIESLIQRNTGLNILSLTAFSGSLRHSLANIDRAEILVILVTSVKAE